MNFQYRTEMNLSICKFMKLFKKFQKLSHFFVGHLQKIMIFYKDMCEKKWEKGGIHTSNKINKSEGRAYPNLFKNQKN